MSSNSIARVIFGFTRRIQERNIDAVAVQLSLVITFGGASHANKSKRTKLVRNLAIIFCWQHGWVGQ
jgi:hypothetical protein